MVINLDWIPFIAFGIAILAFLFHLRPRSYQNPQPNGNQYGYGAGWGYGSGWGYGWGWGYGYGRGNPIWGLIFSAVAMVGFGLMSLRTASEVKAFRSDPVCAAGLPAVEGTASSLCRIQSAQIIGHEVVHSRHSTSYYVDLDLGNGGRCQVSLYHFSSAFWSGIVTGQDRMADVELFQNNVVELETPSGTVETWAHPIVANSNYTLMGVLFGGLGVIFALALAFRNTSPGYAF